MMKKSKAISGLARSAGFSLVELLIVISVITLLLGLLLPALRRARCVAEQAICKSRLRQWALAFGMYAEQNDGFYPHTDGRDRTSSAPETDAERADYYFGWIDLLPPLVGQRAWRDHDYWQKPGTETIFQCRSARLGPDSSYKYRPRRTGYFSYAMNSCLELDENCHWWESEGCDKPMSSFLNTALIKKPQQVILLFDQLLDPGLGYDGRIENGQAGKYCGAYPREFSARHAKSRGVLGGFVLYCDYSVEWKSSVWEAGWAEDLYVPPRDDVNWFPY